MVTVTVDTDNCKGDGLVFLCVELCPTHVFESKEVPGYEGMKSVVVNNDACIACRACESQCSARGITITE
jgi:NAD-dependent dihydropyrimidine dehydrogenase PreA subunit